MLITNYLCLRIGRLDWYMVSLRLTRVSLHLARGEQSKTTTSTKGITNENTI